MTKEQNNKVPELYDEKRLKSIFESDFLQKKLNEAKASYTKFLNQTNNSFSKK